MLRALLTATVVAVWLAGCATPPPAPPPAPVDTARTVVVLLPDEDGHVGAVTVRTNTGSRDIDHAYASAHVDGAEARLSEVQALGEERVRADFGQVLAAQPTKPRSFILYFVLGTTTLTDESKALLPTVLATARERAPTEIAVFGHADALGSERRNVELSADRARAVAEALRSYDPRIERIQVQYFGAKEPLWPAPPNAPEPRNRRVEIVIL